MTDPSGKLAPLLVGMGIAALGGAAVGGLAGGGINLVSQLMSHRGNFACVNWGDVANAAFDGMVMGGIGGMVGFMAGPSMLGLGVAAAADVAVGAAYDTLRYGTPPSESLMNNMIALGLGQGVGVAVKKAFKAAGSDVVNEALRGRLSVSRLGRSLRGVRDDVVGGLRGAADDLGRLLRGRFRPAGGALDWDDGFGPRVLRMADDGEGRLPRQKGFEELPGGDDFAQLPTRRGTPRIGSQTGDTARNARELNRRMEAAYVPRPEGDVAAHHIVPSTDPKAYDVRVLLAELGIDINSAANGVYMLQPDHTALHKVPRYIDAVEDLLSAVKTREEGISVLNEIREAILRGDFP